MSDREQDALRERFFVFVDELTAQGQEIVDEALPQFRELAASTDPTLNNPEAGRMQSAIEGQLHSLAEKANEAWGTQIDTPEHQEDDWIDLVIDSGERISALEQQIDDWLIQLSQALQPDYEAEYLKILQEFEANRGSYTCQRCGAVLPVDHIFTTELSLGCLECQTQNRFSPSPSARALEGFVRTMIEMRYSKLLEQKALCEQEAKPLHQRLHELSVEGTSALAEMGQIRQRLRQLNETAARAYDAYIAYSIRDFTEIVPETADRYEKIYQEMLRSHRQAIAEESRTIERLL